MISVNKRKDAPASLANKKSYTEADTVKALKEDAHNKCYICETFAPHGINVEHFEEHGEDPEKKFGWHNLLFACEHCNHTKNDVFRNVKSNLINCTNSEVYPDLWIAHRYRFLSGRPTAVFIKTAEAPAEYDCQISNTVKLLRAAFNGKDAKIRSNESFNLMNDLTNEIFDFYSLVVDYLNETDQTTKECIHYNLELLTRDDSQFAAFKRWILKDKNIQL